MIPPLVLDVKPGHWVLDMCAAPGSKTAQLAEFLEDRETSTRGFYGRYLALFLLLLIIVFHSTSGSGLLVANDADYRRAQIMVRQVKRVNSPCLIVTNHEAQMFPGVTVKHPDGTEGPISFDRILADVPCSGDGTLRKNLPIWKDWNPHTANSLHTLQLRILMRAVQLCRPGGRIVYSTCSMNPVENEAVVAEAIRKSEIPLELLDAAQMLPNLKSRPGMLKWKVMTKTGVLCGTAEEAPVESPISKVPSLFAQPDLESLNIARW